MFGTLSLTLREEHGLRCSGRKVEEVTGSRRKSRNRELVVFVLLAKCYYGVQIMEDGVSGAGNGGRPEVHAGNLSGNRKERDGVEELDKHGQIIVK
jgi:hypothetical protein